MGNQAKIRVVCKQCKSTRPPSLEDRAPCPNCGSLQNALLLAIPHNEQGEDPELEPISHPEFDGKSVVAYYSSFVIEDPRLLTSLCLYHDNILLFSRQKPEETLQTLRLKAEEDASFKDELIRLERFLAKSLPTLSNGGLIRVVTAEDCDKIFPESGQLPINANILKKIMGLDSVQNSKTRKGMTVGELIRSINAYSVAKRYAIPLVGSFSPHSEIPFTTQTSKISSIASLLAHSAITQLALPDIVAYEPEDILLIKETLKEELDEFRVGILDLTWLLRHAVKNGNDFVEIKHEAEFLVNTKIKAALLSLETRMRQHRDGRMRRMLFGASRIFINGVKLFLPGSASEVLVGAGKSLFQLAVEMDTVKQPENQIASFIYELKKPHGK